MTVFLFLIAALIGYILGSIPFGLLIGRIFGKTDVREIGSGKIGMTNVMRAAGKKAAVLALTLDLAKGALAVIFAGLILSSDSYAGTPWIREGAQVLAAFTAIAGHTWSIFLKFKGGRGVATFLGGLLALYWPAAIVAGIIMIIVGFVSRYMSLGSITGAVSAFIMLIVLLMVRDYTLEYLLYTIYAMMCAIFIFLIHRDNIYRLVSGTERKIGDKVKAGTSSLSGNLR
jgi:glycerol-3-phosphate acyltransferase PlsY